MYRTTRISEMSHTINGMQMRVRLSLAAPRALGCHVRQLGLSYSNLWRYNVFRMAVLQIDSEDRRLSKQAMDSELSPSLVNFSHLSSKGDRDDTKAHLSPKGLCSICVFYQVGIPHIWGYCNVQRILSIACPNGCGWRFNGMGMAFTIFHSPCSPSLVAQTYS